MSVTAILGIVMLFIPPASALPLAVQSAQTSKPPDSSTPAVTTPPVATVSKPCPVTTSAASSNCKPAVHKIRHKKQNPTPPAGAPPDGPTKTVVRNGSTTDPTVAISAGMNEQQISQQKQNTDQLLASADANLKTISTRQLSAAQQDTVTQIKSFMEQAKAASSSGDVQRAYNLANKANMLSADLKGH
jgi:hypothetical protein